MGNICCGGTERSKSGALYSTTDGSNDDVLKPGMDTDNPNLIHSHQNSNHPDDITSGAHPNSTTSGLHPDNLPDDTAAASEHLAKVMADTRKELERQRALREEQARLETIVSTAGRDMVPVARGAAVPMGYYDPSYAHASAQALVERGMVHLCDQHELGNPQIPVAVAGWIPRSALLPQGGDHNTAVVEVLSSGRWHGIDLDRLSKEVVGVASSSAAADQPEYALDEICETFLANVVPTKDKLFQGCYPIVENLP